MIGLRHLRISTRITVLVIGITLFVVLLSGWLGLTLQRSLLQEKMAGVGLRWTPHPPCWRIMRSRPRKAT